MTKKYSSRFLLNPLEPSYFAKLAFFEDELYMLPSPTPYGYLMAENYSLWYIGGSGKDQSFCWLNHFFWEMNPRKNIRPKKCWVSKKSRRDKRHTKNLKNHTNFVTNCENADRKKQLQIMQNSIAFRKIVVLSLYDQYLRSYGQIYVYIPLKRV